MDRDPRRSRLAEEAVLYSPRSPRPLVERRDSSVFALGAVHKNRLLPSDVMQKGVPEWVPPPDHPEIQQMFDAHSEGKFYIKHPWEKVSPSLNNKTLPVPYQFRVPAELSGPTCAAQRAHIRKHAHRSSVSDPPQVVEFDEDVHTELVPLERSASPRGLISLK